MNIPDQPNKWSRGLDLALDNIPEAHSETWTVADEHGSIASLLFLSEAVDLVLQLQTPRISCRAYVILGSNGELVHPDLQRSMIDTLAMARKASPDASPSDVDDFVQWYVREWHQVLDGALVHVSQWVDPDERDSELRVYLDQKMVNRPIEVDPTEPNPAVWLMALGMAEKYMMSALDTWRMLKEVGQK